MILILLCGEILKNLYNRQQHAKLKWSLFNGKLEKRLTIYEYLLNYCIVQTDGEKVWMWLTKGEGKKEGRQNRVAQDIWSLVHNQVSLARTSLLGSLENYITMRSKKYEVKPKFLLSFDFMDILESYHRENVLKYGFNHSKGQIILESIYDVFAWTKNGTKLFLYFCSSL